MIRAAALSKRFGTNWALRPLTLEFATGETTILVGPNGSGKTTLLKLIAGILRPTAGSILIEEMPPRAIKGRIGYLGHDQFLYPFLTSIENLRFWCTMYDAPASRGDRILEQVGMTHRKDALAQSLSRGEAQRLALGRAVIHDPDFLLLDEPFTGLDVAGAEIVPEIIGRPGRTIVMASHDRGRAGARGVAAPSPYDLAAPEAANPRSQVWPMAETVFEMDPPRN